MKKGDSVTHKTGIMMVVIAYKADYQNRGVIDCRFYNPTTGTFELYSFNDFEFVEFESNI